MGWSRRNIAVMAACTALAGCTSTSPDTEPSPSPSDDKSLPLSDPGDGGTVTVTETGVSMVEDPEGRPVANFAIVADNDSALVAAEVGLTVTMLDSKGDPVTDEVNEGTEVSHRIPAIMPESSAGIGFYTIVDSDVESIEVSVEEVKWWPADNSRQPFERLETSNVSADVDGGAAEVAFAVESGYPDRLDDADAVALFRDEDGKLLGGSGIGDFSGSALPSGDSDQSLEVDYAVPSGTAAEETRVYVYPQRIS